MATTATRSEPTFDRGWAAYRVKSRLDLAQGWFLGGLCLSLLGFVMPWFKHRQSAEW